MAVTVAVHRQTRRVPLQALAASCTVVTGAAMRGTVAFRIGTTTIPTAGTVTTDFAFARQVYNLAYPWES